MTGPGRLLRRLLHRHAWRRVGYGKRACACGAEEWLFERPFPGPDEPRAVWRGMHTRRTAP